MNRNNFLVLCLTLCFLCSCLLVFIQGKNAKEMQHNVERIKSLNENLAGYVCHTFSLSWLSEEEKVFNQILPYMDESTFLVYLPAGLCRSCFSSLLFAFQDNGIELSKISVFSEQSDVEVKSECVSRGARFKIFPTGTEGIEDILVFRLYKGFLPINIKYNLERNSELMLFLSDDSPVIPLK